MELPATPALMTVKDFCAYHAKITEKDVRACVRGTHKTLPPLAAKKKRPGVSEPFLITAEAAAKWRASLPDA